MIVSINMLDKSGIDYDWRTLYVGINMSMVRCNELTTYALKIMEDDKYEDDEFINELAWGIEENLKGEILTKMLLKFNFHMLTPESTSWELEIEKLRYIILNYLRNTIKDDTELLKKIEEVYADFNYPQDMETFITYMPANNSYNLSANSLADNKKCMIDNLDKFLVIEKEKIVAKK